MVMHRTADSRNAHLVAVILDAGDHTLGDPPGVQYTLWQLLTGQIRWTEAQNVSVGDRSRRNAQHIADHTTGAGIGPAERFYRRRAVVRLHLERQVPFIGKLDDSGVIDECRYHPGLIHLLGGSPDIGFQDAVDLLRHRLRVGWCAMCGTGVSHSGLERLMNAVFAPRLRQHFDFGVGRLTVGLVEVIANGSHLVDVQR